MTLKMNLRTKTLWIPISIIVVSGAIAGLLLFNLVNTNSNENLQNDIKKLVETGETQLISVLSIVTASQGPADAMYGLESDDDELAKDTVEQVSALGLDGVLFTGLNGDVIYPRGALLPEGFVLMLTKAAKERGAVNVMFHDRKMFGYAPIIDVETPKGFLVFQVAIPDMLVADVDRAFNEKEKSLHEKEQAGMARYFEETYNAALANKTAFLKKVTGRAMVIMFLALVLIAIVLHKSSMNVIRPVKLLLDAFNKLAGGDLTQEISIRSTDEIASLTNTFNETSRRLSEMLSNISQHSNTVAVSASQLSGASRDIAGNTVDQSDKTSQISSAIEELNSSFVNVAQNTVQAADSAREASSLAANGGSVVSETIGGMTRISESVNESADIIGKLGTRSEQIGEIIQVINDIAGQTNLLALNAAIEAARAGEQGRGFAVVADEVRKLAERTAASTSEIADMVKGIQGDTTRAVESMKAGTLEVEEGVKLANHAGDSLNQIVSSVQSVTDMMQQVATAAEEQSATGEQIAVNVESVAEITRHTAESAQSSSESTHDLDSLAQELQRMVSGFTLRNDTESNSRLTGAGSNQTEDNIQAGNIG